MLALSFALGVTLLLAGAFQSSSSAAPLQRQAAPKLSHPFPWRETDKWLGVDAFQLEVTSITIGRSSWVVHLLVKNISPAWPIRLYPDVVGDKVTASGLQAFPTSRPPSGANGFQGATAFFGKLSPGPFPRLAPGETWKGTISGHDDILRTLKTEAADSGHRNGFYVRVRFGHIAGLPLGPRPTRPGSNWGEPIGLLSNDWKHVSP